MISVDVWEKTPNERRWFTFDFEDILEEGETFAGAPTLTVPAPLVEEQHTVVDTQVQVLISGGTARGRHLIRCTIPTMASETLELAGYLKIVNA